MWVSRASCSISDFRPARSWGFIACFIDKCYRKSNPNAADELKWAWQGRGCWKRKCVVGDFLLLCSAARGGTTEQQRALARILRKSRGTRVFGTRLLEASELLQQIAAHGRQ